MTKEQSCFGQFFFGSNPRRAEREKNVLQYVIHRINGDVPLHDVLQEGYVQRTCSQEVKDEIVNNPELVHAAREHMEQAFGLGELASVKRQRRTSEEGF